MIGSRGCTQARTNARTNARSRSRTHDHTHLIETSQGLHSLPRTRRLRSYTYVCLDPGGSAPLGGVSVRGV